MLEKPKIKKVNYGKAERYSFAKVEENTEDDKNTVPDHGIPD